MERNTFNISVLQRKSKVLSTGLSTIEIYLSQAGKKTYIATPVKMTIKDFERDMSSKKNNTTKNYVQSLYTQINGIIADLNAEGNEWDIYTIKERYLSKSNVITLERLYNEYLTKIENEYKAGLITKGTYLKYKVMGRYINEYNISINYNPNQSVRVINEVWMDNFQTYLLSTLQSTTSAGIINKCKGMFNYAVKKKYISASPFNDVKVIKKTKPVSYLTESEINKIYSTPIPITRLNNIKNLFIVQCLTGLSYADMAALKPYHIKQDGETYYIHKEREKTGIPFTVVLFPVVLEIFKYYNFSLPIVSNQKYNAYLKEVAEYCGITVNLHSHLARHSAATLLLNKGMTIEVVSKTLGHTNCKQTQHYAKLMQSTVLQQFKEVGKSLKVGKELESNSINI